MRGKKWEPRSDQSNEREKKQFFANFPFLLNYQFSDFACHNLNSGGGGGSLALTKSLSIWVSDPYGFSTLPHCLVSRPSLALPTYCLKKAIVRLTKKPYRALCNCRKVCLHLPLKSPFFLPFKNGFTVMHFPMVLLFMRDIKIHKNGQRCREKAVGFHGTCEQSLMMILTRKHGQAPNLTSLSVSMLSQ